MRKYKKRIRSQLAYKSPFVTVVFTLNIFIDILFSLIMETRVGLRVATLQQGQRISLKSSEQVLLQGHTVCSRYMHGGISCETFLAYLCDTLVYICPNFHTYGPFYYWCL
jgi:hypothetical protein